MKRRTIAAMGRIVRTRLSLFAVTLFWGGIAALAAKDVSIPDPYLEQWLRWVLNKPSGAITDTDLSSLTEIFNNDPDGAPEITDLTGLQYATNAQRFMLLFQPFSSIAVFTNLHQLRDVDIYTSEVRDISPLSGHTNLTVLRMGGSLITNVEVIRGLTSLTNLSINEMTPKAVAAAATLTNLEILEAGYCSLRNVEPLLGLAKVRVLSLWGNELTNVAPLTNLTSLQSLALEFNHLDLQSNSPSAVALQVLRDRGVSVSAELQFRTGEMRLIARRGSAFDCVVDVISSNPEIDYYFAWSTNLTDWSSTAAGTGTRSFTFPGLLRYSSNVFFRAEQWPRH